MSDPNNPWDQVSRKASNRASDKKKFKKSGHQSDGRSSDRTFDKPKKAPLAPKLKGDPSKSKPLTDTVPRKGLILKDRKIIDAAAAEAETSYEIVPLTNPADEKVPIKSKPSISGGLIPTAAPDFRSGFVSIVGRPNVGKSTLMNYLVGQKIAITSPVAQTTRNRLQGILTTPQAQIIFVDTPGIHKPHHELGKVLVQNARMAINSVDVVLFVVEATSAAGKGDLFVSNLVAQTKGPVVLGVNKVDQLPDSGRKAAEIKNSYDALAAEHGWSVVKFSALTGEGVEELQSKLVEKLEPGPYYYPPDLVTDQPERFIMGELIREQILLHTREEVPHSVAIAIEKVEEDKNITRILATVNVERKSQKGILIGKGGLMMKAISTAAREQMQKLVAGKVYLEIFVRVQERWRQSRTRLSEFGYKVEK